MCWYHVAKENRIGKNVAKENRIGKMRSAKDTAQNTGNVTSHLASRAECTCDKNVIVRHKKECKGRGDEQTSCTFLQLNHGKT